MRTSLSERRKQYRAIYESIFENPRAFAIDISSTLQIDRNTVSRRMKEAFEEGYITKPQIRKRSYANLKEYVYFINSKRPVKLYNQYSTDTSIVYHAVLTGSPNLWVISKEQLDIKEDVVFEGVRSDFHISYAPNHSWTTAVQIMRKKVDDFASKSYEPEKIIKSHWDEPIEWDSEFEFLYREYKFDLRKKQTPVRKKYLLSGSKMQKWFQTLPKTCSILLSYFPESISAYDPYFFIFETDHEDFIVDIFSELPTSSFFFTVSNRLCIYAHLSRQLVRHTGLDENDISNLGITLLIEDLLERNIVKSEQHTIVEYAWLKPM